MKHRKTFTKKQKEEAVKLLLSGRKTAQEIADDLGIGDFGKYQVMRWKNKLTSRQQETDSPQVDAVFASGENKVIIELKVKIADLMMENERLKALLGHSKRRSDKNFMRPTL